MTALPFPSDRQTDVVSVPTQTPHLRQDDPHAELAHKTIHYKTSQTHHTLHNTKNIIPKQQTMKRTLPHDVGIVGLAIAAVRKILNVFTEIPSKKRKRILYVFHGPTSVRMASNTMTRIVYRRFETTLEPMKST